MDEEQKPSEGTGKESRTEAGPSEKVKVVGRKVPKPRLSPPKRPIKKRPSYQGLKEDRLLSKLKEEFPEAVLSGQSFLGQPIYCFSLESLYEVMVYLKDSAECKMDYLVDLTALDYLDDEKRFCVVYHLYSYQNSNLIRVKTRLAEDESVPSVTSIWKTANWLEREVYDLFGIQFSGHPDLRRILLPEGWHGFPLRKDYDIKLQDQTWIGEHLRIRKIPE